MKLTKSQLKQIIKKELMAEGGISLPRKAAAAWRGIKGGRPGAGYGDQHLIVLAKQQIKETVNEVIALIRKEWSRKMRKLEPQGLSPGDREYRDIHEHHEDDYKELASLLKELAEELESRAREAGRRGKPKSDPETMRVIPGEFH